MYEYKNEGNGTITMFDSKGKGYCLMPGQTARTDALIHAEQYGIVRKKIEEQKPTTKKRITKTEVEEPITKEEDNNDSNSSTA